MSCAALLLITQRRYLETKIKLLKSTKDLPTIERKTKKEIMIIQEENSK